MSENEVLQAIRERRCVRKFSDKPVPRELIEKVVEAGLWAPSGMGRQSSIVLAVTDSKVRNRLAEANRKVMGAPEGTDPFYGAPVVLVVLADANCPTAVEDGSVTLENMLLAAHSLGLGGCWIHRARQEFEQPEFKELLVKLGVKGDYIGVGHCILGWPDQVPEVKPRRDGRVFWVE
ncbi:MAG: nitroreductase [Tractidigestivibacter sp.]|jgi:nitroreductase|uniref:nitroreductase n=1 Tax=Tractidigestivibacter sp. TaxID=2847320 RepID=UPI003D93F84F